MIPVINESYNPYWQEDVIEDDMINNPRTSRSKKPSMDNPFKDLTTAQKNNLEQQGQAIGLSGLGLTKAIRKHGSLEDAAQAMGYAPEIAQTIGSYVPPDKIQKSQIQATVFADTLNKYFNDYIDKSGPYKDAFTIKGYTPSLLIDQLTGSNKKDQINYLTAQGLARDTAVQQVLMSNMRAGHFSVKAIEQALQHVSPAFNMVDADVRRGVMNNIHKVFKEGTKESRDSVHPRKLFARYLAEQMGIDNEQQEPDTQQNNNQGSVRFSDDTGRTYTIPMSRQDAIQEAQRRGWRQVQ